MVRFVILASVVILAFVAVEVLERARFRRHSALGAGVTLVTGPDCTLCDAAARALRAAGLEPQVVPVGSIPGLGVRAVPTALVVSGGGELLLRRAGRTVLREVPAIAAAARNAGVGP